MDAVPSLLLDKEDHEDRLFYRCYNVIFNCHFDCIFSILLLLLLENWNETSDIFPVPTNDEFEIHLPVDKLLEENSFPVNIHGHAQHDEVPSIPAAPAPASTPITATYQRKTVDSKNTMSTPAKISS